MGLFGKLQSKLELYRIEQKYARRKNRTTFSTGAQYVDGEYVYPTSGTDSLNSPTMSANSTGGSNSSNKRRTILWAAPDHRR